MRSFLYAPHPARIIFGSGVLAQLPDEARRLGLRRLLVVSTADQADLAGRASALLGEVAAACFTGATMHTPVDVTERALQLVRDGGIDGLVAVGGGSTTGLAKAIALRTDLPQIVVPTTYAGSEVTPIVGETRDGVKVTTTTLAVLPEVVIYDVDLTLSLPPAISVTSGLNAIAHAVESLYARDRNPVIELYAVEAIRVLAHSLPRIVALPDEAGARADALYGAWLCGTCLGAVGMSLHHKLCHTLGGAFALPHAETHAVILPHALAYNEPAVPDAMAALRRALDTADPARALHDLARSLGAPAALRDLGMPEAGIDHACDLALTNAYWNPRPLERTALRSVVAAAWAGDPPQRV